MASERSTNVQDTYSPVPASTYNLKEKIKWIFFEEAQFLYQNFITVNSVALVGTLSITINGNEDTGVIEVSERTDRSPSGDSSDNPTSTKSTGSSLYHGPEDIAEVNAVGAISNMAMPSLVSSMPKVFDKNLFERITSLGQLELMKKYADFEDNKSTKNWNTDEAAKNTLVKSAVGLEDHQQQSQTPTRGEEEEEEVAEDWEEDGTEEEEEKEDKKDVDYTPELKECATILDEGDERSENDKEDEDEDVSDVDDDGDGGDDDIWTAKTRRSKRKVPMRRHIAKPVIPKRKGRRTAAKLSLKIKLKKLTKSTKSKKVAMVTEEAKAAREMERRRYEDNDAGDLTCKACGKQFQSKKSFKRHCDRHWKSFQCDQCGKPFSSVDSLFHHKKGLHSSTKPYSCEECGNTFNFHHSYKLHLQKHSGERPYQCGDCSKSYLTATHLKAHREAIHETETQNTYVCDTCGKTFTYKNSLKTHQMIHTGDRPYKCSICKKGFVTRQALKTHEDSYHVQGRNFQCDICFKYYKSEHLRNVHRRRHTSDVNRFMCDICGRQFMFKSNLDAHSFVHQDDRPFVCSICQKNFKCMSSLYTHQYTHKSTTPFKCSICSKSFKTKNCLKAHEKRHNAEKKYMCSSCGACFPDKGGMTKHIRTIHAPQKQFVCKFCGKVGTRADNMRTHIKSHGKEAGDLNASECILEVPASSIENSDDVKEITAKSIILSKGMRIKSDASSMSKRPGRPPDRGGMYCPADCSTVLLPGLETQSLVAYQAPGALSDVMYQSPRSPPPQPAGMYQRPASPRSTYQPPLSPQHYPQLPSPHGHPVSMPILVNSGVSHIHMETLDTTVGQTQPLMPTSGPGHMGVVERSLLSSGIPMSVHGQNHPHGNPHRNPLGNPLGPAMFPPILQGRDNI